MPLPTPSPVQRALFRLDHPRSPRSVNKIRKLCIYCGKEFWVFPCLQRVECCSRACASQIKGALFKGPRLPAIRPCSKCGMIANVGRRSWCLKCQCANVRKNQKRWMLIPEKLDRIRERARKYARQIQADPARRRMRNLRTAEVEARRRARIKGTRAGRISYLRILEIHGMICSVCNLPIGEEKGELSFDHVVPLVRGGAHVEDNLRPAHNLCNRRKNRRLLEEMKCLSLT